MDKKSNFIIIFIITLSIFTNVLYVSEKSIGTKVNAPIENEGINEGYKEKLIRFHVLANSDEEVDQELKLKVRDRLIDNMNDKFKSSESIEETREIVKKNIKEMKEIALEEIKKNGKDYSVDIKLEPHEFPTKSYGDFTLPAGEYEAVRVLIGEAKGENWWCVMFPPLCFVDAKSALADGETEESMKEYLTEEEYKEISTSGGEIKLKSKLVETIKEWTSK